MKAMALIDDIFRRPQRGNENNVRRVSPAQLKYLRDLIESEGPRAAIRQGAPGSLIWMPSGPSKYILTEDLSGNRHTLTRLLNLETGDAGSLFG